jgi:hypothetical protein
MSSQVRIGNPGIRSGDSLVSSSSSSSGGVEITDFARFPDQDGLETQAGDLGAKL